MILRFYSIRIFLNDMNSKKLIIIIACFAAGAGIILFLTWPGFQKFQELQKNIEFKKTDLATKVEYYALINKTAAELDLYKEEFDKISQNTMASEFVLPSLFDLLAQKASQNGLILEEIKLGGIIAVKENPPTGGTKQTNISLQVAGSYDSFKNFLLALEKSARLINIQDISFSTPSEPSKPFLFKLNIQTYGY